MRRVSQETVERRKAISREIVERYVLDRGMDPLTDRMLKATVESYDEHFTRAGIPTDRFRDVYMEAFAEHGDYLLTVADYLKAWYRLRERETERMRTANTLMPFCQTCKGTGVFSVHIPKEARDEWRACPYCKPAPKGLIVRKQDGEEESEN